MGWFDQGWSWMMNSETTPDADWVIRSIRPGSKRLLGSGSGARLRLQITEHICTGATRWSPAVSAGSGARSCRNAGGRWSVWCTASDGYSLTQRYSTRERTIHWWSTMAVHGGHV